MAFKNYGLRQLGSWVAGLSPSPPSHMGFGAGSGPIDNSVDHMQDEFMRKSITWGFSGNDPVGNVNVVTTEANGSDFRELSITPSGTIGSDVFAHVTSGIGTKNNTFDVNISFTVPFRRR